MAAIEVRHLHHTYGHGNKSAVAVADVSFTVEENEFYTLLGPSGCGKTSTLRCIAGLERPTSGEITLGGTVVVSDRIFVPTHRRDIGMVFQDYAVWPHMTVFDNVAFPLRMKSGHQRRRAETRDRVMRVLDLMNMAHLAERRPTQLSGGQQQRLSLARALVREPEVLLLDEPLSSLDARLRAQMRTELRRVQRSLKVTTIFVTHDQVEALSLSNKVAVMNDGNIVQEGDPRTVYFRPKTEFVGTFVGAAMLFAGTVVSIDTDSPEPHAVIQTDFGLLRSADVSAVVLDRECTIMVRPESVRLTELRPTDAPNVYPGTIELALFVGDAVEYEVDIAGVRVQAKAVGEHRYRRKDKVFVEFPPHQCVVLPQAGEPSPSPVPSV